MKKVVFTLLIVFILSFSVTYAGPGSGFFIEPPDEGSGAPIESLDLVYSGYQVQLSSTSGYNISGLYIPGPTMVDVYFDPTNAYGCGLILLNDPDIDLYFKFVEGEVYSSEFFVINAWVETFTAADGIYLSSSPLQLRTTYDTIDEVYNNNRVTENVSDISDNVNVYLPYANAQIEVGNEVRGSDLFSAWNAYQTTDESRVLVSEISTASGGLNHYLVIRSEADATIEIHNDFLSMYPYIRVFNVNNYDSFDELPFNSGVYPLYQTYFVYEF